MAYPSASGSVSHSGTSIPVKYALALLVEFYRATVFGAIATTEFEKYVSDSGDTVRIRTLPTINAKDYVKGQKLEYEDPEPGYVDLLINKGKYWAISENDVDLQQFDQDLATKWAEHASVALKVAVDYSVLSSVYSDAHASNKGTTAGAISGGFDLGASGDPHGLTTDNIVGWIVDCGTVLDEQNVPDEDRWFLLPSWACGLIKQSELKDASLAGDGTSMLRNGRIGMIDRFHIYRTNNLATATDTVQVTNTMFGHKSAIAFASQMKKVETVRNPDDFGVLVRMLQVFGHKTIKSEALGHGYVKKG